MLAFANFFLPLLLFLVWVWVWVWQSKPKTTKCSRNTFGALNYGVLLLLIAREAGIVGLRFGYGFCFGTEMGGKKGRILANYCWLSRISITISIHPLGMLIVYWIAADEAVVVFQFSGKSPPCKLNRTLYLPAIIQRREGAPVSACLFLFYAALHLTHSNN